MEIPKSYKKLTSQTLGLLVKTTNLLMVANYYLAGYQQRRLKINFKPVLQENGNKIT